MTQKIKSWIKLIRIKHWVKNVIVFFPLFFGKVLDITTILRGASSFVAFSFLASSIYIFNDIIDVEKDKRHPIKCKRPIAAGVISVRQGMAGHFILLMLGFCIFVFIGKAVCFLPAILLYIGYYIINLFYTLKGKNIPLMDIVILASGFLIRLFFGSMVTGVIVSEWLYLVIMAGAFYLGLSKRRNELIHQKSIGNGQESRAVLKYYNYQFLDKNMYLCLTLTILFYSLWCTECGEKKTYLLSTVPLVLIIAMKYSLNIEKEGADGDPTDTILGDKILLLLIALLAIMMFIILYSL